jgi:hypothetical protein
MLPYYNLELIARERQKDILREAEKIELINPLRQKKRDKHEYFWRIVNRFGMQMERWGRQLQNHNVKAIGAEGK